MTSWFDFAISTAGVGIDSVWTWVPEYVLSRDLIEEGISKKLIKPKYFFKKFQKCSGKN